MKHIVLFTLVTLLCSCSAMNYDMAMSRKGEAVVANNKVYSAKDVKAVPTAKAQPSVPGRVLIYTAEVRILTSDLISAADSIRDLSVKAGGYLTYSDGRKITVRIPAEKLNSFLENLSSTGKITGSKVQADDVTDRIFDLETRLKNAEKLRERLTKLVEKAGKLEDALKVEKELARVTGELELLKGMLKKMKESVSYSKVTIYLNTPEPVKETIALPFRWIHGLARDLRNPRIPSPYIGGVFNRGLDVDYPKGFAAFYEYGTENWATDGNGSFMKVIRSNTEVEAGTEFWKTAVSNYLQKTRLIMITETTDVDTASGKGFFIKGKFGSGSRQMNYYLLVVPGDDKILTSEVWGLSDRLGEKEIEGVLTKADVSL